MTYATTADITARYPGALDAAAIDSALTYAGAVSGRSGTTAAVC